MPRLSCAQLGICTYRGTVNHVGRGERIVFENRNKLRGTIPTFKDKRRRYRRQRTTDYRQKTKSTSYNRRGHAIIARISFLLLVWQRKIIHIPLGRTACRSTPSSHCEDISIHVSLFCIAPPTSRPFLYLLNSFLFRRVYGHSLHTASNMASKGDLYSIHSLFVPLQPPTHFLPSPPTAFALSSPSPLTFWHQTLPPVVIDTPP
jgi:hypothetical protein